MVQRGDARGPSPSAFASLLGRLGPDADSAGLAYETLRRTLVGYFNWRGAATPEECADETLDRLATRLGEGVEVQDVPRFARGIARLVLLEHWRRPDAQRATLDEPPDPAAAVGPGDDALHECLDRCLSELPSDGSKLILEYYVDEGRSRIERRRVLARALGVSETALRNRAQRLRERLERCITECVARRPPGSSDTEA
jgi:DNA-directed RNA polymerase specialized sigma24 family protein